MAINTFSILGQAQSSGTITGKWSAPDNKSIIQIQNKNGIIMGKIFWINPTEYINHEPHKDLRNPNTNLRSRSINGIIVLSGFKYDPSDKDWQVKSIYDPKRGIYFEGMIKLSENNKLMVKEFLSGMKWFAKTEICKRVN